jgi:ATP-binding cassette, subfamily B, bacterial PglK
VNLLPKNAAGIISLFDTSKKKKISITLFSQFIISFLDLAGIGIIGVLAVIAIRGFEGVAPSQTTSNVLAWLHISKYSLELQTLILGVLAAIFFILKTWLSIFLTKKFLTDLAEAGADYSSRIVSKLLNQTVVNLNQISFQKIAFALTTGVEKAFFGVAGPILTALADVFLLAIVLISLLIVNPFLAIYTYALFILSGLAIYKSLSGRAEQLGHDQAKNQVDSYVMMSQAVLSFREIVVQDRTDYYKKSISNLRGESLRISSRFSLMPNISKYVVEAVLVAGIFSLCAIEFLLHDAARAVGMIAIFLAAASRISPAVLRVQQNLITARNSMGQVTTAFETLSSFAEPSIEHLDILGIDESTEFVGSVHVKHVDYGYPDSETLALKQVSIEIKQGEFVAIVGSSGAGKSTLVDVILGLTPPTSGEVLISNLSPLVAYKLWPGSVSYVPQDAQVFDCSIADNVALGHDDSKAFEVEIRDALSRASLIDFVDSLPDGMQTIVGDRGAKLSGGQRQRLGIARALFSKPKILVLDEATSALDAETEAAVSTALNTLKGSTTLIVVAHRLSSVRDADKVILIQNGIVAGVGTFDELKALSPEFEAQANLMGL